MKSYFCPAGAAVDPRTLIESAIELLRGMTVEGF